MGHQLQNRGNPIPLNPNQRIGHMKSIDIKSLLIGILGTALVMVLMGQSNFQKQYDVECVSFIDPKVVMDPTIENNWVQCRRFDLSKKMGRGDVDYQKWQWNNWDRW